jgi:hypothetical protein
MENKYIYTGNISLADFKPNYNISFQNHAGEKVGTLDFNTGKLVFTGNAEESANVFIDFIARRFEARLEQERQAEREACAKVVEDEDVAPTDDAVGVQQCIAAAIRARST